ncbi:MAG: UDP-2,3-diacylglucosamine diphosphatase LpxI [Candidatus Aminicenantales bacterium]
MGTRIGLIAGSGEFPFLAVEEARKQGYECIVAGIRGEAASILKMKADAFEWVEPAEIVQLLTFFRKHEIREILMVGKIQPRTIYARGLAEKAALDLLAPLPSRSPSTVLRALMGVLAREGMTVKDPSFLLHPYFCRAGVLSEVQPAAEILDDITFGWSIAKSIADADVGQTIIVKNKAVVAVEGMEGTDEVIRRGGRLAGEGIVVIKVARTDQDMRIDIPTVGLETMKNLIRVKGAALCFEALRMPFFQKEETLALANANGIAVVVRNP